MAKADDTSSYWKQSMTRLANLNYIDTAARSKKIATLPIGANHATCMFSSNMVFPRSAYKLPQVQTMEPTIPGMPDLENFHTNGAHTPYAYQPCNTNTRTLLQAANSFSKEKHAASMHENFNNASPNLIFGPATKKFLIFDRSGNQTRLVLDPTTYRPSHNTAATAYANSVRACELDAEVTGYMGKMHHMKPIMQEELDENIAREESEMHEDSEDIDALLYSDDDDEDDIDNDGCGVSISEDDDEISTGHSPIGTIEGHDKQEQIAIRKEDGPTKRLRLWNGAYSTSKLAPSSPVRLPKSFNDDVDDDADSSFTKGRNLRVEASSILGKKRSRQDKIRNTLEILETLIPGGKGKDPLLILDEAIKYLISLKLKAKARGASVL